MKKYKVLFCDLDGTLITTTSGEVFPKGIWDMKIRFDVLDAIKNLAPEYVFIVSNQGGIEKGFVKPGLFKTKIEYVAAAIKDYCGIKKACDQRFCKLNNPKCTDRKPNTGMLSQLCNFYELKGVIEKSEFLMIGDASGKEGQFGDSDKKTAENFGIDYLDVEDFVHTPFMEGFPSYLTGGLYLVRVDSPTTAIYRRPRITGNWEVTVRKEKDKFIGITHPLKGMVLEEATLDDFLEENGGNKLEDLIESHA